MKDFTKRQLLAAMSLTAGAVATGRSAAQSLDVPPTSLEQAVDALATEVMTSASYAGLGLAIEKTGRPLLIKGYGAADLEAGLSVGADTIFALGSVTKSFTALAIMQLVEAGRVSLDAPLSTYLPKVKAPVGDVMVRRLLNHTSGIANYTSLPAFPTDLLRSFTHAEVIGYVVDLPLEFPPGERFSYSNTNTYLLGMIVEAVSGSSYGEYLAANVFRPFGMTRTKVAGSREIVRGRARGYAVAAQGEWINARGYDVNYPFSAGAVTSTPGDMLKYRRGVFGPAGRTSDKVRRLLLTRDPLNDGTPLFYSLGCLTVGEFEGRRQIAHSGDIEGFASHYAYYPEDDVTIAVLANTEHATIAPYAISRKLARLVLSIEPPQVRDLAVPTGALAAHAGDYVLEKIQFGTPRYGFVAVDGKLFMRFGGVDAPGPLVPLLYQGGGLYVTAPDTEFRLLFAQRRGVMTVTVEFYDGVFVGRRTA